MNWLAHLVLADDTPESLIGNLAGDFLKGAAPGDLHPSLAAGIARHRAVDAFTDAHPVTAASRARIDARWRLFSRVLVDVFYDHFLAAEFTRFTGRRLEPFTRRVYAALESHRHLLPPRLAQAAPLMVRHDWLNAYAHIEGIAEIMERMGHRTRRRVALRGAMEDLRREYPALRADFAAFFPQLRSHIQQNSA